MTESNTPAQKSTLPASKPNQPVSQPAAAKPAPTQPNKTSGTSAAIIIIIVVVALLVLGIGGYFAWKYFFKDKSTNDNSDTSKTTEDAKFTLSKLEEMLKYPNGTLTSTDHSEDSGYTSVLEMETTDSVVTVNTYYLNLDAKQKWTITAKSLESDNSRADITYEGKKDTFTVHFIIDHVYENTSILVRIDAEDLPIGTPSDTDSTTTPSTDSQTGTTPTNEYIIADSNTRIISESELTSFTPWQLKVARNEIYARHGRAFVHKDLQCYFAKQSWYEIDPNYSSSTLSSIENKNVATILNYEEEINSPLLRHDSGC